ncbi:hypothetical protein ACLB2K_074708 [Fragaria x ananassa]
MAGDDSKGKDVVQPRVPQPWENNPYHELYLHHSDQTGGALIPILLEEDNYQSWQEAIQDALDVKNKTGFLDGTLERPEADGEERQQWQRCNTMVKHWLLGSMSKTMHKSVARMKDAKSIWDELKERFTQTGCLSMIQIEEALNKVDQGSSTVNAYYTRLKTLWDERDALIVYPTCKCNLTQECHCEAAGRKVLQSFLETNKTMKFLLGLNGSFAQTRNNITAVEPIMPLNKVLAMVLRHEKQDVIVADKQTPVSVEASAFAAKIVAKKGGSDNGGKQGSSEYGGRYCEKCKETTHSTKYCRAHITCTYCGGKGHSIDYCRTKKRREGQGGSSMTPKANAVVKQPDFSGFRLSTKECDNMLGLISKIREASRDASDDNHLLDMMSSSSANFVGKGPRIDYMSGNVIALVSEAVDVLWLIDSGATDHIVHDHSLLTTTRKVEHKQVRLPNGVLLPVTHIGTVRFTDEFVLHNVLCVPQFFLNLISVSKLALDTLCATVFIRTICFIQDLQTGKMIGTGVEKEGLYCLNVPQSGACNSVRTSPELPWHERLGHPSAKVSSLFPFPITKPCVPEQCHICPLAKQTRTPFPLSQSSSQSIFDLIHVDIWGGYRVPAISGAKFFLTIVDDYSRASWIFLMHAKSEARSLLQNFIILVENQFETKVKTVRSDNGPEFNCKDFYAQRGILHQTSCVSTPQQNGIAERKHRHLQNVARALLFQSNLPPEYWGDAILTAAYLINRTPTPLLHGKTPYEKLFQKPPKYDHLRVFGCKCYVSTHNLKPDKFEPRSKVCIFLGYPHGKKGYKVMDLESQSTFVSRDVVFNEKEFFDWENSTFTENLSTIRHNSLPFARLTPTHKTNPSPLPFSPVKSVFPLESASTPIPLSLDSSNPPNPHNNVAPSPSPIITPSFPQSPPSSDNHSLSDFSDDSSGPTSTNIPMQPHSNPTTTQTIPHPIPSSPAPLPPPSPPLPPPRRSTRATRPPPKLDQFHVETQLPSRSSPSSSSNALRRVAKWGNGFSEEWGTLTSED